MSVQGNRFVYFGHNHHHHHNPLIIVTHITTPTDITTPIIISAIATTTIITTIIIIVNTTIYVVELIFFLRFHHITGLFRQILHSFSIIRNIKLIMNTNVEKSDLTYLHGMRVLSLFWIILLHVNVDSVAQLWPYGMIVEFNTRRCIACKTR